MERGAGNGPRLQEPARPHGAPEAAIALLDQIRAALDPSRRTPLYEQLAQELQRLIAAGALTAGTVLPPEPELAVRLGLSRQTVNLALTGLARRGLLSRRRGVGTFIAPTAIEQPLDGLYSFLRTLISQGRRPATKLLGYRLTLDDIASPLLTGQPDGLVFEAGRLRLVDGEPFALETLYLPVECGERLPLERLTEDVLYDLLQRHCGLTVSHAEETLRPVTLSPRDAAQLGLRPGAPAFLVERTGYAGETAIEFRSSLIRGDRFHYRVRLEGPLFASGAL